MTIENLQQALDIFLAAGVKGYALCAEHDILYVGANEGAELIPPDSPDGQRLKALGMHIDSESESWAAFV
jgi:hypothetical protein